MTSSSSSHYHPLAFAFAEGFPSGNIEKSPDMKTPSTKPFLAISDAIVSLLRPLSLLISPLLSSPLFSSLLPGPILNLGSRRPVSCFENDSLGSHPQEGVLECLLYHFALFSCLNCPDKSMAATTVSQDRFSPVTPPLISCSALYLHKVRPPTWWGDANKPEQFGFASQFEQLISPNPR